MSLQKAVVPDCLFLLPVMLAAAPSVQKRMQFSLFEKKNNFRFN
jgi:hypothetical protein